MQYACSTCGKPSSQRQCPAHRPGPRPRGNANEPVRQAVLERDGWRCQLRYDGCTGRADVVDHIVSRVRGGSDRIENLQAACAHCNSLKGSLDA